MTPPAPRHIPTSWCSPLPPQQIRVMGRLRKLCPRKAASPYKVCPLLLKICADESEGASTMSLEPQSIAVESGHPLENIIIASFQYLKEPDNRVDNGILYLLNRAHSHLDKVKQHKGQKPLHGVLSAPGRTVQDAGRLLPGCLDFYLPHWQTAVHQAEGHLVWNCGQQQKITTGDCVVPAPCHSVMQSCLVMFNPAHSLLRDKHRDLNLMTKNTRRSMVTGASLYSITQEILKKNFI